MIFYEPIIQPLTGSSSCSMDVLRLDLIDPEFGGNKWFKLKHNLEAAVSGNFKTVITFGGAFSNHIAATAAACKKYNLKSIGIIRGEEKKSLNPTLQKAKEQDMDLYFVSREAYLQKETAAFAEFLEAQFGSHYIIPEGGNNRLGILGCQEILNSGWNYDYVFCACGTAATYAGLVTHKKQDQKIIGISVLKGENKLPFDAERSGLLVGQKIKIKGNEALETEFLEEDCILNAYAFKGYAALDEKLLAFKALFESGHQVPLDHVYTVKLMYAVFDLLKKNKLKPGSRSLVIHSGGLQGNTGFEARYHLTPSL